MSTVNEALNGLQIVAKYTGDKYDIYADHDILYAGADAVSLMSDEDKQGMLDAGWHWDNGAGSYAIFV